MGWLFLFVFGIGAMAALALLGVARPLWSFVGAGLMLGGAGYAWQGRPLLKAHPATPAATAIPEDASETALRGAMFGRYTADDAYLVAADALTRSGDRQAAASLLLGGLHALPRSVELWTAYGSAVAAHDGDQVSASSLFAFQQAERLSPRHPGPPFFLGLAYVRAGDFIDADKCWRRALALTPPGASYYGDIAGRVMLLDRYLMFVAAQGAAGGGATP